MQPVPPPLARSVLNRVGGLLRNIGVRWPRLDAEDLMVAARRRTGLSDWGDDRFRQGLRILVESFDRQDTAHTFGRLFFREFCIGLLVNRLKVQDEWNRHPEIRAVPVRRPLFVTGLPRSGTTFLHRLLSQDPLARPLLFWETLEPAPPPEPAAARTDPRIAGRPSDPRSRGSGAGAPRRPPLRAQSAEECNALFAQNFSAAMLAYMFDAPGYIDWLESLDRVENYRYFKAQLQLLSWKCRATTGCSRRRPTCSAWRPSRRSSRTRAWS